MLPDQVFDFEPPAAQALDWLPLAVRYKLDGCGLKVRLVQWQALTRDIRAALVRCPIGAEFEALVLRVIPEASRVAREGPACAWTFDRYLVEKISAWQDATVRDLALQSLARRQRGGAI